MFIETCRKNGIPDEWYAFEKDPELLAEGWERSGYDQYLAEYKYSIVADVRKWIPEVMVKFRKRTDIRDRMTFGFSKTSMIGYYKYPTPPELLNEIARDIYDRISESKYAKILCDMELASSVKEKMMPFLREHLIEDEYEALCELKRNPKLKDTPIRCNVSQCRGFFVER